MLDFLNKIYSHFDSSSINFFTILVLIIIYAIVIFTSNKIIKKLQKRIANDNKKQIILTSLKKPLNFFFLSCFTAIITIFLQKYSNYSLIIAHRTFTVGLTFSLIWFGWRMIISYENYFTEDKKNKYDLTTILAIIKLLKAILIIVFLLMALNQFGISLSGIIAFGGIGGIAIGFAAKDLLANFFGAIMIYLDRPFSVGDWVKSPDRNIEGTVTNIGWRLTKIRTFESRMLYVPNSIFSNIAIENPSRMSNRRIFETIGVRYNDVKKVGAIIEKVRNMLENHEDIESKKTLMVNLNKFNEFSVDFFIYTFTKTTNWEEFHEVKQKILLQISDIIDNEGAEIAFPTSEVKLSGGLEK
ncbi:MAG: MscS family membrane protein [Rickettsiales bacterium]|jgi:MscS family membrane protein